MNYYIGQSNTSNWIGIDEGPFSSKEELKKAILLRIKELSGDDAPILMNTLIAATPRKTNALNLRASEAKVMPLSDARDEEVKAAYHAAVDGLMDDGFMVDEKELAAALAEAEADLRNC